MNLSDEQLLQLYRWMLMERLMDEKTNELFRMGKIMSMFHSVLGQEAANVGAAFALQPGDVFTPSHRGKVIYLMRGMDLDYFMAGMFGRKEGFGQGRTPVGSHMSGDVSLGLIPAQGAIGSSFNAGVGAALALKLQHRPHAALVICGDGGSNRGDVHEGMNLAAVLGLPAVFYFINNGWSLSVRAERGMSVQHISTRAAGYGLAGVTVDGHDVLKVYDAVADGLRQAREGKGPLLVEALVDRWTAHSVNDPDIYRTDEERARAREVDPLQEYEAVLGERGLLDEAAKQMIRAELELQLDAAVEYAEACTEPGFDEMVFGVYRSES